MKNYDPETKEYYFDDSDLLLVNQAMNTIKKYCESNPTCEGCRRYNNDKVLGKSGGCYFRHHSPREWKTDN
jgi:hypothetical protein